MSIIRNIARASALFLVVLASSASADSVTLSGPASVAPGDSFQLTVIGDFAMDGLLAGGVVVGFDPALVSIDNITTVVAGSDPGFTCPGTCHNLEGPNEIQLAWGNFSNLFNIGDPAANLTIIDLTALAPGLADFSMVNDPNNMLTDVSFALSNATVSGTSVNIVPSAIPVPAAVWLFGSGLLGLVGVARRRVAA